MTWYCAQFSGRRLFQLVPAILFVSLTSSSAHGELTAADKETARALYSEAEALHASGRDRDALVHYKQAHALANTPITALALGQAHERLGELVEARDIWLSVERIPPAPGESPNAASARPKCKKHAEEIGARIATITFQVVGSPPGAVISLWLDGAKVSTETILIPRRVNPGPHDIAMSFGDGGKPTHVTVSLAEGEKRSLTLNASQSNGEPLGVPLPAAASPATSPNPTPTAQPAAATSPAPARSLPTKAVGIAHSAPSAAADLKAEAGKDPNTAAYIWGGIGIVGLATGAALRGVAFGKQSAIDSHCPNTRCDSTGWDSVNSAKTLQTTSTISFVLGGAALSVGIVLGIVNWRSHEKSQVALYPLALRHGGGVTLVSGF